MARTRRDARSFHAVREHGFGASDRTPAIDFFSWTPFDPAALVREISYVEGTEPVQVASDTLTCRVECGGPVLVSFFGNLRLGEVAPREIAEGSKVNVASLLDVAGTKALTVQQRAQARDYVDIDALIRHGIDLPQVLAAGAAVDPASLPVFTPYARHDNGRAP